MVALLTALITGLDVSYCLGPAERQNCDSKMIELREQTARMIPHEKPEAYLELRG